MSFSSLRDCSSTNSNFCKGNVYSCEVFGRYVKIGSFYYIFYYGGGVLRLDEQFRDFFMSFNDYRRLKLEKLGSLSSVVFGD